MMIAYDKQFLDEVDDFLDEGGYESIAEWMEDSDYLFTEGGYWVDLDDNPVEPLGVIHAAMEACGFYDNA